MPLKSPLSYYRTRRAASHYTKPLCIQKISSRPYINPQSTSPLFTHLPPELRSQIFTYALHATPDLSRPYAPSSHHYRPGYECARKIATELLLVCRRVYAETYLMPVALNEHVFWGGEASHGPPGGRGRYLVDNGLRRGQRERVGRVRVFCQQFWLEDWNDREQWHDFCRSWAGPSASGSDLVAGQHGNGTRVVNLNANANSKSRRKSSGGMLRRRSETQQSSVRVAEYGGNRRVSALSESEPERDLDTDPVGRRGVPSGLKTLRITIRHTDWWYYLLGERSPLALDPFKAGRASRARPSPSPSPSTSSPSSSTPEQGSWGTRFIYFHSLQTFELELETTVEKAAELEAVVKEARVWRFLLGNGKVLAFDGERGVERSCWEGRKIEGARGRGGGRGETAGAEEGEEGEGVRQEYFVVLLVWRAVEGDHSVGPRVGVDEASLEVGEAVDSDTTSATIPTATAASMAAFPPPPPQTVVSARGSRGRDAVPTYYG